MPDRRILVVEDEESLVVTLRDRLTSEGYAVDVAMNGDVALETATRTLYDLILLDVALPGRSGFDVCRDLRGRGVQTPILMLTARGQIIDRVLGFKLGADDYLTKPFAFAELVARIKALARRPRTKSSAILKVGDLEFDTIKRRAKIGEHALNLSPKEKMLLELLMRHAGQVVTRDMIAETVWDANYNSLTNLIEVFVNRLRQKIDPRADRSLIITVRGEGYTMRAE